jgi:hypothetical protein
MQSRKEKLIERGQIKRRCKEERRTRLRMGKEKDENKKRKTD